MKVQKALFIFLLLTMSVGLMPKSQATGVTTGPVEAEVDLEEMPNCSIEVIPGICIASWEKGEDASVGDDDVRLRQFVNSANVTVRSEILPQQQILVDPSGMTIEHPLNYVLNYTWVGLNDSLPDLAKGFVTFESRSIQKSESNTPWGLLVVVHFPIMIHDPFGEWSTDWFSFPIYSWDCSYYFTNYSKGDQTCSKDHIRPFPNGIRTGDSTDRRLDVIVGFLPCENRYTNVSSKTCPVFDSGYEAGGEIVAAWKNATPNIHNGAGVDKVSGAIEPPGGGAWNDSSASDQRDPFTPTDSFMHPAKTPSDKAKFFPPSPSGQDSPTPSTGGWLPPTKTATATTSNARSDAEEDAWMRFALAVAAVAGLLLSLALALFHRVSRNRILDNPNRRRIFETIRQEPGVRAGTLGKRLELNYGTVLRHLRMLERFGMVEGVGKGQRRFFVNGGACGPLEKREILAASSPASKAILEYLGKTQTCTFSDLCSGSGLPRSTASEALSRLEKGGLVRKDRSSGQLVIGLAGQSAAKTAPTSAGPGSAQSA